MEEARKYELGDILSTRKENADNRIRQAREGHMRIDPAQQTQGDESTLVLVWAHLNITRVDHEDYAYWTMGTQLLLTEPVRLTEMYPHLRRGERPFRIGFSSVEAHRNYPAGDVEQGASLQEADTASGPRRSPAIA
jgi:hypothetical protein